MGVQSVVFNVWLFVSFSYYVCDGGSGASCRVPAWRRSDRLLRGSQKHHQHWTKWSTLYWQLVRLHVHQSVGSFVSVYERKIIIFLPFFEHILRKITQKISVFSVICFNVYLCCISVSMNLFLFQPLLKFSFMPAFNLITFFYE